VRRPWIVVGGAAAVAAALLALVIARPWRPVPPSWAAAVRGGSAMRDGKPITGATRLPVGAWLESGESRVRLLVADIGTVELGPGTRARIVATGAERHELRIERGSLVATIEAPPRRFVVDTPRAVVTDLGCAFELTVDETGRGRLVVTGGKVGVADVGGANEIVVPAGSGVELTERGASAPAQPNAPPTIAPSAPPTIAPNAPPTIAPKSPHHPEHAGAHKPTHAPQPHALPSHTPAAPQAHKPASPTNKPAPSPRIEHDPLKELERSVP
jgi:hypothetical protein